MTRKDVAVSFTADLKMSCCRFRTDFWSAHVKAKKTGSTKWKHSAADCATAWVGIEQSAYPTARPRTEYNGNQLQPVVTMMSCEARETEYLDSRHEPCKSALSTVPWGKVDNFSGNATLSAMGNRDLRASELWKS